MNATVAGISVGAVLAVIGLIWGFGGFALAAILMLIGAVVGRAIEGKADVKGAWDALNGRRSS